MRERPVAARGKREAVGNVDHGLRALEIHVLNEGPYQLHCVAEEKGKLTSLVLTGLEFDLAEIQDPKEL